MLLIYTHKITPRFTYTMKQIFGRILNMDIAFTTKVEDFIKHTEEKITYTKQPLQNEFFIRSNDLLFEQGISDLQIQMGSWDGTPCFFSAGERSAVPFDIFAASFFLLSRYEEYLPHVKDIYGRYPPSESLALQHNFLHLPIVDIWARMFLKAMQERFPNLKTGQKEYKFNSIINVTISHCFANRGFIRTAVGFMLDLTSFRLKRVASRFMVLLGFRKDPYNNFSQLTEIHKAESIKSMFFFQFAEYSTYDKNISTNNNRFRYLIKSVADYSIVSLAASYVSFSKSDILKEEKKRLAQVINRPVKYVRLRYNRVNVPDTYRNLVDVGFTDDFSMGYTHEIGFRAGTCTPFYFYDIHLELQQPIKIHPFALHDYAFANEKNENDIFNKIDGLYLEVKKVEGEFITIFSNELLGQKNNVDWMKLYENVLKKYHV